MAVKKKLIPLTCWPLFLVMGLVAYGLTAGWAEEQVGAENQALNVVFTAKPVKKDFEIGEKIVFSFSLRNEGQQDVAVRAFVLGHDVYLEITGPDGDKVQWSGGVPTLLFEKLHVLHPGEVRTASLDIQYEEEAGLGGYPIKEPGKYRMTAEYYIPGEVKYLKRKAPATATVAKGPFEAEPVEFWLVPKGSEKDTPN